MQPSYRIQVDQNAIQSIHSLDADDQIRVESILDQVAQNEKPTDHPKCEILSNNHSENLYKIRIGDFRCLFELDKPMMNVLKFDRRKNVYDDVDKLYEDL